jgi:fusaric acid resistance family protein
VRVTAFRDIFHRVRRRLDGETLGRIAQSAIAAGLAWELALRVPDHGRPFFAPIAAVIGLAADRGRRGRQASHMIVGVALGIVTGAAVVALVGVGGWQLVVASALTLAVATGAGAPPVIRTQATASAILIVALHVPGTNVALQRLVDALIGGGIAIVTARFLFPVEPLDLVRREAAALRTALADALDAAAAAIEARDRERAERALARLDEVDRRPLEDALALARDVVRHAPRRRPLRRRLDALGTAWHELDRSVADGRAIGTGAVRVVSRAEEPPPTAATAVHAAAAAVRAVEPGEARGRADAARAAARRLLAEDASLGSSVVAHGVAAVADHALRAADARDEDLRLREQARARRVRLPRPRVSRSSR